MINFFNTLTLIVVSISFFYLYTSYSKLTIDTCSSFISLLSIEISSKLQFKFLLSNVSIILLDSFNSFIPGFLALTFAATV